MDEDVKIIDDETEEDEGYSYEYTERQVTVGDVIAVQVILCILVVITLVILNQVKPDLTKEAINFAKSQLNKPYEMSPQLSEAFDKLKGIIHV